MSELTGMENRKVRVEVGRVVNLGDYESYRVAVAIEDTATSRETNEQAIDRLFKTAHNGMTEKINDALRAMQAHR